MSEKLRVVTIDGPAGSGKSTVSKTLANKLGFTYLDTGAMYRAVAYACKLAQVDPQDTNALEMLLQGMEIELKAPTKSGKDVSVYVNGDSVGEFIRTQEMGMLASAVSALGPVRKYLTALQQEMGAAGGIVAEGRDTGTVVFPQAAWKFYLDAQAEVRMKRRAQQHREKGDEVDEQELLAEILQRDKDDSERALAPLKQADDALLIDSSHKNADAVIEEMFTYISDNPL